MKVSLVKFNKDHILGANYLSWLNDPEVNKYLCVARLPMDYDDLLKETKATRFAVLVGQDFVGTCSFSELDYINRKAEIGYMIGNKDYWGKGIATQIISELCNMAFNRLNLNKLTAGVVEGNTGSMKALEKNGFKLYAIEIQDQWVEGRYLNTHRFYRLKDLK